MTDTVLWKIVRDWLKKQKHISQRITVEVLEFGPPHAELCSIGNRYNVADIYDDKIIFYNTKDNTIIAYNNVIIVHAQDPNFFKKIKQQLVDFLHLTNLNWPPHLDNN